MTLIIDMHACMYSVWPWIMSSACATLVLQAYMHVVTDCMLCGCILQALHMPALGLQVHVIRYQFEYEKHILQVFYCYTVPDCVGCHEQPIDVTSNIYDIWHARLIYSMWTARFGWFSLTVFDDIIDDVMCIPDSASLGLLPSATSCSVQFNIDIDFF